MFYHIIKSDKKMADLIITKNDYLNKIENQKLSSEEDAKYKKFLKFFIRLSICIKRYTI